ncbi:MAG TPA: Eco47II family restriction endonuclease, partial [Flavobacterium sp.]|nr:Eco47II family restriction endonuclease [Giesbergeria sp.]HRN46218.1 Eco47II family restriction endonuclease [Flavobacterium sp.]MBP6320821.1 Eco47II family restriction endonuclease [Giesbergeria sp.]MBP7915919.1 Eco47II family restriction endonuclease [Giesbergeria sp.]MBP8028666.1 Eco47II family restriction endonuclease [Giesbergeria sp.]
MKRYNLHFIQDSDLFEHVKCTVLKYRFAIDLQQFNSNLIDPIKLTFDAKVYKKDIEDVLESEVIRQLDKSNTNHIGYFHQNIFRYIGGGDWEVPDQGYDIVNLKQQIFVEMKNKHNTMNSSSSQKTYMRMQNTLLKNESAVCMLVEVIAANSQNMPWVASMDGVRVAHEKIRRVSIDKFYEIVTGDQFAFKKLCEILPRVIEDVVASIQIAESSNTVLNELKKIDSNLLKSIYLMSFKKYQGFNEFAC